MECLNCNKDFESDNNRKVYCSGKCKVAYHRKNRKKENVTKFDLKVLYNEILDLAQKMGKGQIVEQPQKVYDAPKLPDNFRDEPKQWENHEAVDDLQEWKDQINNCESIEELNYIGQKISASNLSRWQQNILTKYGKMMGEKKSFL